MILARQVSILVLEYYLLSTSFIASPNTVCFLDCVGSQKDVEALLKKEADSATIAWRKRLIMKGGVANASKVDARGLLLFVAGFGILNVFKDEDLCNLSATPEDLVPVR
ncbi:Inactive protein FRIGIDA [Spatholobus suberectus]|nr:Inactive protein FRIGIDA [Spatholobus suberectus]